MVVKAKDDKNDKEKDTDKEKKEKEKPKPAGPLIDENFRLAAEKRLPLPDGWSGDGLRVITVKDRHGLEVAKASGTEVAKIPLRQPMKGDFTIEAGGIMPLYFHVPGHSPGR